MENEITIGIVEDHLIFRKSVVTFLNSYGNYKVAFELSNGKGVVESLKKHMPDILLLDLQMPDVDGFTALKEIRKHFPYQKVIIYSSYYTREDGRLVFENVAQEYITKQVSLVELLKTIDRVHVS